MVRVSVGPCAFSSRMSVIFDSVIITIMIIITLFQKDNVFGTNASLTYGLQIQRNVCV